MMFFKLISIYAFFITFAVYFVEYKECVKNASNCVDSAIKSDLEAINKRIEKFH